MLRWLKQFAFDAQIPKGPEIGAHYVARIEKRPELALQLGDQSVVSHVLRCVVAGDQASQAVREFFDRIADVGEPLLA